ncbi:valine--tRNA ligase [Anaerolineales bacterium HSG25]|nr:valine--tRNA ligase [Anaerolineales bacterium HSG25]
MSLPIDTSTMAKAYDPKLFEETIYNWWESQGYFKPEIAPDDAEPFVISMPPPNVTGALHLGHAITASIEDLMIRYNRMNGKAALWVPGTDHAGIATQLQVENMLRNEGTSRQEVGREEFLRRTWAWKEKYDGMITQQHRRLGASCDWDRERFTMDEGLSRAVREAFVRLYEKGLIYRGEYLINWSPGLQTAVSDLEVEYSQEEGKMYHFKYMLADSQNEPANAVAGQDYVPVATTRPETLLGDTAVAVHPEDERYQHLIGKKCLVPMLGREIPIIADEYVDREFGTGALKITPGHDPNDFEIGKKYGLPIINIMNRDATINKNGGQYNGLDRFECRKKIWADMEADGITLEVKSHLMQVPRSQRGGEVVEPLVSTQWFVKMESLAAAGLETVADGKITIVPERFAKVYNNWLDNIRDWCISRQLWWGHRIPVWHCGDCQGMTVTREDPSACAHCQSSNIEQDPDVLDTWFSSGLWPFSTLGWPDDTPDLRRYYPTSVMETGYDILFFWVARMIMSGLEYTDQPPFHTVYMHGLIRDEHGKKMSKTTGNVVDPLEVMDKYGTDALRFTLLTGSTPGNDMNLSFSRIESNRNFCNKIWNAARFVASYFDGDIHPTSTLNLGQLTIPDRWILSRSNEITAEVTRFIDAYNFGEAGRQLYDFFWSEFADWYIEIAKIRLQGDDDFAKQTAQQVLLHVLDRTLRLLHPFIPFLTEAVWQHLPHQGDSLMMRPWPQTTGKFDTNATERMNRLIDLIRAIRNIRSEYNVEPAKWISAQIVAGDDLGLLKNHQEILVRLARLDATQLTIVASLDEKPAQAASQVTSSGIEIYLPLAGMIDITAEKGRLNKEIGNLEKRIMGSQKKLGNQGFINKAPAAVVEKEREKLADMELQLTKLNEQLQQLGEDA